MPATNDEIDQAILAVFAQGKTATNLVLGIRLLNSFGENLPRTNKNHYWKQSDLRNAQELANRACQRLRKAGKLVYGDKIWQRA
jgi:hypothetical protein